MNEQQLLELKEEINEAKTEVAELKGQKKSLLTQLKENWECTTIEVAQKKVKKMQSSIEDLQTQIDQETIELEKHFEEE